MDETPARTALTIRRIDPADDAKLERHVAFEQAWGTARFDVAGLRAWLPTVDHAALFAAEREGGELVGCATASMVAVLGASVQVNAFCRPGESDVLAELVDAVSAWAAGHGATDFIAHVSAPTPTQDAAWRAAGLELRATRSRVERRLSAREQLPEAELPDGLRIVSAADRPDLDDAVLAAWNEMHADIPSVLPFQAMDRTAWRDELGVGPDEPLPSSLLVALDDDDQIAGMAFLNPFPGDEGVAGHRFTGTARAWRGKGLATAMKVAAMRWAVEHDIEVLRASNDEANAPMRAVNERLGYEQAYAIALYGRPINATSGKRST